MKKHINPKVYHYGREILESERFNSMEEFIQHGDISVRQHSISVAEDCLKFIRKFRIKCDERAVVRGALLHDYFLYDWHEKELWHNWHGFRHAGIALHNAVKDYDLTPRERDIIEKHMWPLNVKLPKCREAWIVNLIDDYCSLLETLKIRKKRHYTHLEPKVEQKSA